ncbi:MAG: NADH-quinone oxidoreductase subunit H [Oligoflexia bacterium]|nr:NADH-quinone oxidoreductase subunit H [Oligoflexia bacterium]
MMKYSLIFLYIFLTLFWLIRFYFSSADIKKRLLELFQGSQLPLLISLISVYLVFQDSDIINIGIFEKWGIVTLPALTILYFISIYMLTMKFPFDIDNYSSSLSVIKLFDFIYFTVAMVAGVFLFLGGKQCFPIINLYVNEKSILINVLMVIFKLGIVILFFSIIKKRLLRFSGQEVFLLSWKILFPLALINLLVVLFLKYYLVI